VNRAGAKASTHLKVGDRIEAMLENLRVLEVVVLVDKRVSAALAAKYFIDHSPPVPVVKRLPSAFARERGTGRPTKRDRRVLDRLKERPWRRRARGDDRGLEIER